MGTRREDLIRPRVLLVEQDRHGIDYLRDAFSEQGCECEVALDLSCQILQNATDEGADIVVTACPLCHANLDMRQGQINDEYGTDLDIPVVYFTQLMGVSYGIDAKTLGMDKHFTDAISLLKEKDLLAD